MLLQLLISWKCHLISWKIGKKFGVLKNGKKLDFLKNVTFFRSPGKCDFRSPETRSHDHSSIMTLHHFQNFVQKPCRRYCCSPFQTCLFVCKISGKIVFWKYPFMLNFSERAKLSSAENFFLFSKHSSHLKFYSV